MDNFKNRDREILDQGRRFAERVLDDPSLFSELMLKAKEASPYANRTNREEMDSWLISIIRNYPNTTTKQIQEILKRDYDKNLGINIAGYYLARLSQGEDPKIIFEKTKSGNVYRVANAENHSIPSQT